MTVILETHSHEKKNTTIVDFHCDSYLTEYLILTLQVRVPYIYTYIYIYMREHNFVIIAHAKVEVISKHSGLSRNAHTFSKFLWLLKDFEYTLDGQRTPLKNV